MNKLCLCRAFMNIGHVLYTSQLVLETPVLQYVSYKRCNLGDFSQIKSSLKRQFSLCLTFMLCD